MSRQATHLSQLRVQLRRLQRRSPQMRPLVEPEMARMRELARQLKKVSGREDLQRWRSLLEMCLPALQALLGAAPAPRKAHRRQRSAGKRGARSRAHR